METEELELAGASDAGFAKQDRMIIIAKGIESLIRKLRDNRANL